MSLGIEDQDNIVGWWPIALLGEQARGSILARCNEMFDEARTVGPRLDRIHHELHRHARLLDGVVGD